ncbi:O-antigen ligase family protein [Chryseobacterium lactis]|nr:O-antigen ligase family protein [Chryseobacterium lactis]
MGSFVSPALFTNFIIVAIPGILWLYKNEKHKIGKITYILTIVTSILICFLTDSKLSWLTIAIISFIYFLFLYKNQISVWKKILFFAFSCAIAVVAVLIFFQDSTSGRFFVFKNSLALLGSSFYKGIGIGNFDYYYNLVQADYIRMHPSRYFTNVTYIETAYNEPLQFLIEGGILSFILMLFLVFNVYKYRVYLLKNIEITLGLGSFLIISLFSFPFRTSAVCVLLILYLGIFLSGIKKEKISCKYGKIILGFIVLINTITIIRIAGIESDLMKWRALEQHDVSLSNKQSELIYKDLFKTFGNDKDFLLAFANNRLEYKDFDTAIKLLERASLRSSKLDIFLLLGVNYEKIGNYRKAEENYIKCKYFDPDIVRPRYELMRLYLQQKRLEEAKKTAQDILNTPIKVKSKQAFEIRKYAQKIMDIRSL